MKKQVLTVILILLAALISVNEAQAQARTGIGIKTNLPLILVGTPNIGIEMTVGSQFSVNGDFLWMPYMFKKHGEVFRTLMGSAELRYYVKPKYYYTNNMFDGFYLGPYVQSGKFNIGLYKGAEKESYRYVGWGIAAGATVGYKFYLGKRFRLDINMGIGYAHIQYDKYLLGGEWANYPLEIKNTKVWVGPTKFGVHLVYNIFK